MKEVMKVLTQKDAEMKSTISMMKMLGLDPNDESTINLEDATQSKLYAVYQEQKAVHAKTKKKLEAHYADMVQAAEQLTMKQNQLKAHESKTKDIEQKVEEIEQEVAEAEDDGCVVM